jgi:hypothetical protein
MRRTYVAFALAFLLVTPRTAGAADEAEPSVGLALGAGAALAIAPLCAGGAAFANSDDLDVRRPALYVALAGLTLAPVVAHLIVREYARAGLAALAPVVGSALAIAMVEAYPELLDHGDPTVRVTFGVGLSLAVVGSVLGLADLPGASDRWRARHPLTVAPLVSRGGGGLAFGGRF